ncbi:MAG TPA: hypothetical protein GX513_08325 [Firmicutes bacterium]|nr:hypothetical protein [Bacillota bacterium]
MRSILAYFASDRAGEEAVRRLRNLGLRDMEVERISRYPAPVAEGLDEVQRPFPVTYTGLEDRMDRALVAADPGNSGMAGAGGLAGGGAFVLVIPEVPADKVEAAVHIIKEQGGQV